VSTVRSQLTPVFWISATLTLAFVLWGVLSTETFTRVTGAARDVVIVDFGWLYLVATTTFLVFVIALAFSRYEKIKLGKPDDLPELGRFSWLAMLFQAGMGIGLVFWAVSELLSHFSEPPTAWPRPDRCRRPTWRCATRSSTGPSTPGPCTR
jgi:choline-glycine betaine transporter